ncbi:glycoside hydrolase family 47 protein [Serpula lacrymans var. lacrymans S7.9]|uniref:alpha-1,2-Mannosidase n=1 Tax=Serpula lacrymans var. lacrymans (strain S7.9) TaxID=578457 RepID=F8P486_SERL9|nr:glycoside hydrolase family 47 protein [Serpula lacrymans var. lacrymans S7.9]EGO22334.1 glycoside hydrolase family 47 protein [Serpula lacrymans var. lacrymans S7.9]
MPSILSDALISISLRRKGISLRHVIFALAFSVSLWTLYYAYRRRTTVSFPEEAVYYPPEPPEIWAERAVQVKKAFLHAYHGYERYAAPWDELKPVTHGKVNNFNGWGVTAIDSLDTMLMMGLKDEYQRALSIVQQSNFSLPENTAVPFFETVIRYLGGLLSAYAMSKDNILRTRADELGSILAPAFNTSSVDVGGSIGILAEIASFQMEYTYLGKITGKKEHVDRATKVTRLFSQADLRAFGGMYPTRWNLTSGSWADGHLSVGAAADSAHEYTLKQYLLTAQTDKANLEMYLRATTHIINDLLFISPERQLLYVTDTHTNGNSSRPSHLFEHLSCFFPGLLALGAHTLPLDQLDILGIDLNDLGSNLFPGARKGYAAASSYNLKDLHLWAAEGLAQTCWLTYADQPSGLGPDVVLMQSGGRSWMEAMGSWKRWGSKGPPPGVGHKLPWSDDAIRPHSQSKTKDYLVKTATYYLRPETIESFYILWRVTGDVRWRHHGWAVFQAIEREAKTDSGYANVDKVMGSPAQQLDSMPSYFLAETLKYLYLLFIDEDIVPLEKWVFNTEAHPLPIFEWSQREREAYGIL